MPLFLAFVYALLAASHFFGSRHRVTNTFDWFSLALVPIWLVIATVHWMKRREFRSEPDYTKEQILEFKDDGIFRGTDATTKVRVPWTKISRCVETDEFFLLSSPWPWGSEKPGKPSVIGRQDLPVLYIIPNRALDSADLAPFRELLEKRLSVWAKNPDLKKSPIPTAF